MSSLLKCFWSSTFCLPKKTAGNISNPTPWSHDENTCGEGLEDLGGMGVVVVVVVVVDVAELDSKMVSPFSGIGF